MRKYLPLNHDWLFKPSLNEADPFEIVQIPHTVKELPYNYFDETAYQLVTCYKKVFTPEPLDPQSQLWLRFEGVMLYAKVFLNGTFICSNKGGYTPFEADISAHIKPNEANEIVVHVDATERKDIPPFGNVVDYLAYGGIYREVALEIRHARHLASVKLETHAVLTASPQWLSNIKFSSSLSSEYSVEVTLEKNGETVDKTPRTPVNSQEIKLSGTVKNASLWTLDHPELYDAHVRLYKNDVCVDNLSYAIGFRTVAFKEDGFYLNGTPLKLRGLNRHQAYPYVGYAMPKSAQEKDADILKYDLGVNMVRCSHYPQSVHFLNRCDAIGLLVFEEIPGWQHIGDEDWQQTAIRSVEAMIVRDWNHPSIVIWGVRINESPDSTAFYQATNALAHQLDSTRPTGGVRNFAGSEIFEDVYTYNDFVHRGYNIALEEPIKISKKAMPYLVTEHNGHMFPTKKFDQENKRIEHALRHLRVLNTAYGQKTSSGAIGWCMFDYNTHKDFGSGDKICYHGVLDMFRLPKYAAAVYASQSDIAPVMEVASSMNIGEYNASVIGPVYVFTNCDAVKVYKNNRLIDTYAPSKALYPHLPHPPVVIEDFIGNWIAEDENFTEKDAAVIKRLLLKVVEFGEDLPILDKLAMGKIFLKYKMNTSDAAKLYAKYVANWGSESTVYRFEGYQDGQLVKTIVKSPHSESHLRVTVDAPELVLGDTYDVTRIVIEKTDAYGNLLSYANDVIQLKLTGPAAIIGPQTFALIGGSRAFWVKSVGTPGTVTIDVEGESAFTECIELTVR